MGAWEATAFGNDSASDWLADLERDGAAAVTSALTAATDAEYLEAPEGEEAVAAAEVVATALGHPAPELPPAVRAWVDGHPDAIATSTATLAIAALARVDGPDSELRELWVDDAEDPEWPASIADLRRRLEAARDA